VVLNLFLFNKINICLKLPLGIAYIKTVDVPLCRFSNLNTLFMSTTLKQYLQIVEAREHTRNQYGFDPVFMPDMAFPFQRHGISEALRMGRAALFFDTGLGKTLIQLVTAENIVRHTNKRVLVFTPLAVGFQFLLEAQKIGVSDIEKSKGGFSSKSKIVVTNYEQMEKFDPADFVCVIGDESSILKNDKGQTANMFKRFVTKTPYRFLATATPAPNDYIEFLNSSEALGGPAFMDTLTKFFRNNQNSADARHAGDKWYFKAFAEKAFWDFVASWSLVCTKPSDLGPFDDSMYRLPELIEVNHTIQNDNPLMGQNGQMRLFSMPASGFSEEKQEVKLGLKQRCEKAAELAENCEFYVHWVNMDKEAEVLRQCSPQAVEINGKMSIDKKEEILLAFASLEIKHLITKPTITSQGLNWQHCHNTGVFPSYSWEQYYQLVRRFYRFGQKEKVTVNRILTDGQIKTMLALDAKAERSQHSLDMLLKAVSKSQEVKRYEKPEIKLPSFIK